MNFHIPKGVFRYPKRSGKNRTNIKFQFATISLWNFRTWNLQSWTSGNAPRSAINTTNIWRTFLRLHNVYWKIGYWRPTGIYGVLSKKLRQACGCHPIFYKKRCHHSANSLCPCPCIHFRHYHFHPLANSFMRTCTHFVSSVSGKVMVRSYFAAIKFSFGWCILW